MGNNEQTSFWAGNFGNEYIDRNVEFDTNMATKAWNQMLSKVDTGSIKSILECGANIGRNLLQLKKKYPEVETSLIELNKLAYDKAVSNIKVSHSANSSIVDSQLPENSFDLVFTICVLIHIAPYDLYRNMQKMFNYSSKYILMSEYFSRTLDMKMYRGEQNKLFRMDFGGFFMDNFDVELVDYGFLWGREYDNAGFDDMVWWLFKKK